MSISQPNILLIVADQMASDCLGAAGNNVIQTPHLDRLAGNGTLFRQAYCASPVCGPSRACMATGLLARHHEVYDNAAELSSEIPTIYHSLAAAGYETVGSGKFHFVGPDQLHGLDRRLTTDVFPANFAWTPDWRSEPSESAGMNGSVVRSARVVPSNRYVDFDQETLFRSKEFLRQYGRRREKKSERPFFLQVSFSHPHPPFEPLQRYLDRYPDDVPPPAIPDLPDRPTRYEEWMITLNRLSVDPVSPAEVGYARRCYYAMVSYVDDMVGELLGELEAHGLAQKTVVIFTSDHGEMLGEHGLWFKRMYHEPSVKVPLIVYDPRSGPPPASATTDHGGALYDHPVSLLDLSSEILAIAGADHPIKTDGRGLSVRGGHAIFEYFGKGTCGPLFGIRKENWKLVEVPGDMLLLFDLARDPHERHNAASEHPHIVQQLQDVLYAGLDVSALDRRIRTRQERRHHTRDFHRYRQPNWDYQPHFDATKLYVRPTSGT